MLPCGGVLFPIFGFTGNGVLRNLDNVITIKKHCAPIVLPSLFAFSGPSGLVPGVFALLSQSISNCPISDGEGLSFLSVSGDPHQPRQLDLSSFIFPRSFTIEFQALKSALQLHCEDILVSAFSSPDGYHCGHETLHDPSHFQCLLELHFGPSSLSRRRPSRTRLARGAVGGERECWKPQGGSSMGNYQVVAIINIYLSIYQ